VHTWQVIRGQARAEEQHFPARAVAFLQAHPSSGPIFNHYDWGGYLIWKLYPSTRVFIDGRADLYGERFLEEFVHTYQLKDDWQEALRQWNVITVIVPADSALAPGLQRRNWTVAYEDAQAVVFAAPPSRPSPAASSLATPSPGSPGTGVTVGMQEITPFEQVARYYEGD